MPIFQGEVDPDAYVYHYTTREAALGSILPQAQLRLGLLTWTNDPRENQQWLVSLTSATDGRPHSDEFLEIVREADRLIRATTKVVCLTRDDPDGMLQPPNENFARGWAHSRMWAQYAGGHSGVCLIFERERLAASMEFLRADGDLWCDPVTYANRHHVELEASQLIYDSIVEQGLEAVIDEHIQRHWQGLFFVKNEDWASEREYRWVLRSPDPGPAFVDISGAVAGIVVGQSFPAEDAALLSHYAPTLGSGEVALGRCHWRNGLPSVLPNPEGGSVRV